MSSPVAPFWWPSPQDKTDPNALQRLCGTDGKVVLGDGGAAKMYEALGSLADAGPLSASAAAAAAS